jgi:PleD family two-component response regulator
VLERCAAAPPDLLLIDLDATTEPFALVRALKADARTHAIPLVGFFPHIDPELSRAALEAGIDTVLSRRAFVAKLPGLLTGELTA